MSDVRIAAVFDANLPNLSRPVRINSFYDAQVFIPAKDGGTLRTILQACEYMAAIGKERELRPHWQQVRELMLQEADVAAVSRRVRLAVLKDAKLNVSAVSEPLT